MLLQQEQAEPLEPNANHRMQLAIVRLRGGQQKLVRR
jgi:hypothetical protein